MLTLSCCVSSWVSISSFVLTPSRWFSSRQYEPRVTVCSLFQDKQTGGSKSLSSYKYKTKGTEGVQKHRVSELKRNGVMQTGWVRWIEEKNLVVVNNRRQFLFSVTSVWVGRTPPFLKLSQLQHKTTDTSRVHCT